MEDAARQMPRYRCHKEVWALEIESVDTRTGAWVLRFKDHAFAPREVTGQWFRKHVRDAAEADGGLSGGYFVVYADGYESWSPKAAFEEGYAKL